MSAERDLTIARAVRNHFATVPDPAVDDRAYRAIIAQVDASLGGVQPRRPDVGENPALAHENIEEKIGRADNAAEPPSDLDRMAAALREQWHAQQGGEPYPWEKVAEIHRAGWRAVAAHVMDLLKREESLGGVRESDPIQVDNAAIPGAGRNKTIGPSAFSPAQAAEPPSFHCTRCSVPTGPYAMTLCPKCAAHYEMFNTAIEDTKRAEQQRAAGILFRVANIDWDEDGVCWCAPEHQRPNKHVSYCEAAKAYLAEAAQKGEE